MKFPLIKTAIFLTVFFGTAMLKGCLDSWLRTFELSDGSGISLESYLLFPKATPFAISFFLGGAILGLFVVTRRMAVLCGVLLVGAFVAIYLAFSGFSSLAYMGANSIWQVALSWSNLWAPFVAAVAGAAIANYLLARGRIQHAT
jgi:hypothetical protein